MIQYEHSMVKSVGQTRFYFLFKFDLVDPHPALPVLKLPFFRDSFNKFLSFWK